MFELIPLRERRDSGLLRMDVDSLFERFFDGWPFSYSQKNGEWIPSVDVSETGKEVIVKAEVPGMDPKDIDISIHDGLLAIHGERKMEHEDKDENFCRVERSYGSFSRAIRLPSEVDSEKVEATYKNGVLKIHLPKTEKESVKKIEVKAA